MSAKTPSPTPQSLLPTQPGLPDARAEEIAAQVRSEYARFIEKRDALRKENGRRRRTALLN